ncbi:MAG: hypothetical protein PF495_07325 [Spirochaetales bacterium]|jgi:hypothetical protein|nr:hypothetical protein [Spirochaetales bacterium]
MTCSFLKTNIQVLSAASCCLLSAACSDNERTEKGAPLQENGQLSVVEQSQTPPKNYTEGLSVHDLFLDELACELAEAVASGDTNAIDAAIEKGADVNYVGKDDITPLAWALMNQNKVGFEHLLNREADPNVRFGTRGSLLSLSIDVDDLFFLETALKYGGDPNQRIKFGGTDTISLLWKAITTVVPKPDKVRVLINAGADITEQRHGGGVVKSCAMKNHYENVYIFLEAGASYSTNREPSSLIHCIETRAVHPDDSDHEWLEKVVAFLKEKGIEVNEGMLNIQP